MKAPDCSYCAHAELAVENGIRNASATDITWCLSHFLGRHQVLSYPAITCASVQGELMVPKGGLRHVAVLLSFSVLFDFPQYSESLAHRTIHTVRTNRIIL